MASGKRYRENNREKLKKYQREWRRKKAKEEKRKMSEKLNSPARKIHSCKDCGKDCTGKRCFACDLKDRKNRTVFNKKLGFGVKNPSKKLLLDKVGRGQYFSEKYEFEKKFKEENLNENN